MDGITRVIDQEMSAIGAQRMMLSSLHPRSLWDKTGRWDLAGQELFKVIDRRGADLCLAPTHEELVTHMVANDVHSHKQLPLRLYQISSKYRDEIRPRYGLLRAREFVMKDMYSFDVDVESALHTYDAVKSSYASILHRLHLPHVVAEADSGAIGGSLSHEFQVLSSEGEDAIFKCDHCGYSANVERARTRPTTGGGECVEHQEHELVLRIATPRGAEAAGGVGVCRVRCITKRGVAIQEEKVSVAVTDALGIGHQVLGVVEDVSSEELSPMRGVLVVDDEVDHDVVKHHTVQHHHEEHVVRADVRQAKQGDGCGRCSDGRLQEHRGIEVGHVFFLGTKYSDVMEAVVSGRDNKTNQVQMGCFGLGVTRLLQAVAEVHGDQHGMCLPSVLAPYLVVVAVPERHAGAGVRIAREIVQRIPGYHGRVVLDAGKGGISRKLARARLMGVRAAVVGGTKRLEPRGELQLTRWRCEGANREDQVIHGSMDQVMHALSDDDA